MKLVIWHFDRYPTAPGVYLGCFPRLGHQVTWVVGGEGPRDEIAEREENGARIIEVRRRRDSRLPAPLGTLVNRWHKLLVFFRKAALMRRLAAERPDVLQVRDLVTEGWLAAWCARAAGVRFAFQLDHPHFEGRLVEIEWGSPARPFERAAQRLWMRARRGVLRRADLVFPISNAMAAMLREREGIDPRRLVPFPVGVSRAAFARGGDAAPSPRAAAVAGHPTVCYLGNLNPRRDLGLLFSIFEAVAARVPESRFLVIGQATPAAERALDGFSARERLLFTGFVPHDEVPSLLRAAHVGVFPLALDRFGVYRTSSPLKVVEYMSAGLPVVASRVQDAEEALAASGGGVCVENDPTLFADAIVRYLRDPERARGDGERGRAWVERHRLFEVLARRVEAAYERLLTTGFPAVSAGAGAAPELPPRVVEAVGPTT